jgi:DNA-directed RNA polymerase subunit H (RpoH/RPB5)
MSVAPPPLTYRVYGFLHEMLKTRGLTAITPLKSRDKWADLTIHGYELLEAKGGDSIHVLVALMDINSPHVINAASFEKFMKIIGKHIREKTISMANIDMMVVTHAPLGTNVTNKFSEYEASIKNHPYKMFTSNRLNHDSVPNQRILSIDERRDIMEINHTSLRELARIKITDPVVVWLGAKQGDVIEELTDSEVSGIETKYRFVW